MLMHADDAADDDNDDDDDDNGDGGNDGSDGDGKGDDNCDGDDGDGDGDGDCLGALQGAPLSLGGWRPPDPPPMEALASAPCNGALARRLFEGAPANAP